MRVAVWEYCTAAGVGRDPADPAHALWQLGRSMRDALAADFAALPGATAWGCPESAEPFAAQLAALRSQADWVVPVAPELNGLLGRTLAALAGGPARLLACSPEAVALAGDKLATARHWRANGVPTPALAPPLHFGEGAGGVRSPSDDLAFPLVLKPRDGAGSFATRRVDAPADLPAAVRAAEAAGVPRDRLIVQPFVPGTAVSVPFLCGPAGVVPLAATVMRIGPALEYLGGEAPAPPPLAERATRLATRALAGVPGLLGFVGVDLILGELADGGADVALELNPRLCASYPGLRGLCEGNLAGEMLRLALGESPREVAWKAGPVRWGRSGVGG